MTLTAPASRVYRDQIIGADAREGEVLAFPSSLLDNHSLMGLVELWCVS